MPHHEMEMWRTQLQNLDWSQGFSKEELMQRFPNIPQTYFQNIPSGRKFYSFNEFWNIFMPAGAMGGAMGGPGRETGGPGTAGR
jgi:hypothetical protein